MEIYYSNKLSKNFLFIPKSNKKYKNKHNNIHFKILLQIQICQIYNKIFKQVKIY